MDNFRIDLIPQKSKNKYLPYLHLALGISYIIIAIFYRSNNDTLFWIWIIGGLAFLIISFYEKKHSFQQFIEFNDSGITFKNSIKKTETIPIAEISNITLLPISVEIIKKNNESELISFGNYSYNDVLRFKEKVTLFSKNHNIKIS